MDLASCSEGTVVCDDTPEPPLDLLLVGLQVAAVLLLLAVVLLLLLGGRRRTRRVPARRTRVSADGDVLPGPG